jgi:hypothetical protein
LKLGKQDSEQVLFGRKLKTPIGSGILTSFNSPRECSLEDFKRWTFPSHLVWRLWLPVSR